MRDIKFRVWNTETNKMIINVKEMGVFALQSIYSIDEFLVIPTNEKYPLMQYTGLKDKNGVEIYEGDILVAKNKKDSKNNDWIGIVEDNNYGWLALKYKEYINPSWFGALSTPINEPQNASWIMSNCEVIGNIYENSHLLNNNSLF